MPPARVVKGLEVVKDGELGLASGGDASGGLLIEKLALQRGEHTLGQGVVEAARDAAMLARAPWRRSSRSSACELYSPPRWLW